MKREYLSGIAYLSLVVVVFCAAHAAADAVTAPPEKEAEPVETVEVTTEEITVVEEDHFREVTKMVEEEPELVSLGEFKATAYCDCIKCCGVWSAEHPSRGGDYIQKTASGTIPEEGRTIAADWDVLPKGTEVIINGHTYTVEDTGSGVNDKHIDVFFESHQEALEWGVQTIEVFVKAVEA